MLYIFRDFANLHISRGKIEKQTWKKKHDFPDKIVIVVGKWQGDF